MPDNPQNWLIPTLAGMGVATLRRFRHKRNEKIAVVLMRFTAHVATCMIAGYIVGGILKHFDADSLVAPLCALAGLYGTMLVDWLEESAVEYFDTYVRSKIGRQK